MTPATKESKAAAGRGRVCVILFGPPGVGKGTQAKRMTKDNSLYHVSTGDILRGEVAEGSYFGRLASHYMRNGLLVPDSLIGQIVKKKSLS